MRERDISRQAGRINGNGMGRSRASELLLPMGPTEIGAHDPLPDHTVTYRRVLAYCLLPARCGRRLLENGSPGRPSTNQQPRIKQQPTIKENRL